MDKNYTALQLYFREPIHITDNIILIEPTIGDFIKYGEKDIYGSIAPFISNPTTYRLQLWDAGKDWNKVTDYQLFLYLYSDLISKQNFVFKDLEWKSLIPYQDKDENVIFLNSQNELVFNEEIFNVTSECLRDMFNQHPKVEKAKGRTTKEWIIEDERIKQMAEKKKQSEKEDSILLPLISGLVNHPGFKYKIDELKDIGIYAFMDSVQRIQVYENSNALLSGMYTGMLDTSKIDTKTELNWFRPLSK